MLVGMGEKGELGHELARTTSARVMGSLSKKNGLSVCVRFTSGWSNHRMIDFAEGMMLEIMSSLNIKILRRIISRLLGQFNSSQPQISKTSRRGSF